MSDKNKYKKSSLTGFLRYRGNIMTGEERNSFEKELQKDPFAEEAVEGFASISSEEAKRDMALLQKRLSTKTTRRKGFVYYRIAASVAVLMIISTVFIILERNNSWKQLAETTVQSETFEIYEVQPIKEPAAKDEASEKPAIIAEKKSDKPALQQRKIETVKVAETVANIEIARTRRTDSLTESRTDISEVYVRSEQETAPYAAMAKAKSSPAALVRGNIISSEDNMPVPGANVIIKGTKTSVVTDTGGNFSITLPAKESQTLVASFIGMETKEFEANSDTQIQVSLDPSLSAINEVVVVGYGAKRADSKNEELTGYVPPQPINGKTAFDKYIEENLLRPDTITTGQRVVVVVSFLIHTDGRIDSIRIVRSPDKLFSEEAIRLIKSGPSWIPGRENGKIIEDEVRVRIVFR